MLYLLAHNFNHSFCTMITYRSQLSSHSISCKPFILIFNSVSIKSKTQLSIVICRIQSTRRRGALTQAFNIKTVDNRRLNKLVTMQKLLLSAISFSFILLCVYGTPGIGFKAQQPSVHTIQKYMAFLRERQRLKTLMESSKVWYFEFNCSV